MLVAYIVDLKEFPEAVEAVFPKICVHLCIVHQARVSMRYIPGKNKKSSDGRQKPVIRPTTNSRAMGGCLNMKRNVAGSISD